MDVSATGMPSNSKHNMPCFNCFLLIKRSVTFKSYFSMHNIVLCRRSRSVYIKTGSLEILDALHKQHCRLNNAVEDALVDDCVHVAYVTHADQYCAVKAVHSHSVLFSVYRSECVIIMYSLRLDLQIQTHALTAVRNDAWMYIGSNVWTYRVKRFVRLQYCCSAAYRLLTFHSPFKWHALLRKKGMWPAAWRCVQKLLPIRPRDGIFFSGHVY